MTVLKVSCVLIVAALLAGCAPARIKDEGLLNGSIPYMGWNDLPSPSSGQHTHEFEIRGGMQLGLDWISLVAASGGSQLQELPNGYRYVVPGEDIVDPDGSRVASPDPATHYDRGDVFFLTSIIAMAEQRSRNSPDPDLKEQYFEALKLLPEATFFDAYSAKLREFLQSLRLHRITVAATEAKTIEEAKRLYCTATKSDAAKVNFDATGTELLADFKFHERQAELRLGAFDMLYAGGINPIDAGSLSQWMSTSPAAARARLNIEARIAIKLSDDTDIRYVPPCMSVADIEQELGVKVVALWRRKDMLSRKKDDPIVEVKRDPRASKGYYTIALRSGAVSAPGSDAIDGKGLDRSNVLIAHRDVLVVEERTGIFPKLRGF